MGEVTTADAAGGLRSMGRGREREHEERVGRFGAGARGGGIVIQTNKPASQK